MVAKLPKTKIAGTGLEKGLLTKKRLRVNLWVGFKFTILKTKLNLGQTSLSHGRAVRVD